MTLIYNLNEDCTIYYLTLVISLSVCLSVCMHISKITCPNFTIFSVHAVSGSVLSRQQCVMYFPFFG